MSMRGMLLLVVGVAGVFAPAAWGQRSEPLPEPRAKDGRRSVTGEQYVEGVVDKIGADGITVVQVLKTGEVREHTLVPTDMLRGGEVSESCGARFSYLWADVKRGDTVEVVRNTDHIDKLDYCVKICILRRPKGKLPVWQDKRDRDEFARFQMFNDLDNGEDVSDADIKKLFPAIPEQVKYPDKVIPAIAGGLPADYQKRLDAIRAKKEKDLKAPPPEKK